MSSARRLLLFDLDGTLVDSAPDIADALDRALRTHGHRPIGEGAVRRFVGSGAARLVHRALTGCLEGEAEPRAFAAVHADFLEAYAARLFERTRVYPGVAETLAALHAEGYMLAVVTNKPARLTAPLLRAARLEAWFPIVLSGDSLPRKKPDPTPLLHAAARTGAEPARAVMVGDSLNDLAAARGAGMAAVCVAYGYAGGVDLAAHGADAVIGSMAELPPTLARLPRARPAAAGMR